MIFLALFGVYKAILKKDKYYPEAWTVGALIIFTLLYSIIISFSFPTSIAPSFKRYITPMFPFAFMFLPYIFISNRLIKKNIMKKLFIVMGIVSIFINWLFVQFSGLGTLNNIGNFYIGYAPFLQFLKNGPSSDFLRTLSNVMGWNPLLLNLTGLAFLILIIFLIWKPYSKKSRQTG